MCSQLDAVVARDKKLISEIRPLIETIVKITERLESAFSIHTIAKVRVDCIHWGIIVDWNTDGIVQLESPNGSATILHRVETICGDSYNESSKR